MTIESDNKVAKTIPIHRVPLGSGLEWYRRAWLLFKEQSGLWMQATMFIFALFVISIVLGYVGGVLFYIVQPFLIAGYYHMAYRAHHGLKSEFKDLFVAFNDRRVWRVFIQLVALNLLLAVALMPFEQELLQSLIKHEPLDQQTAWLLTLVNLLSSMFLIYAVPIAYFFHEQSLVFILKTSFSACLKNLPALLLFGFIASGLFMLSMMTLFLGLVIVVPWSLIALFLSFNAILCLDLPLGPDSDSDPDSKSDQDMTFLV